MVREVKQEKKRRKKKREVGIRNRKTKINQRNPREKKRSCLQCFTSQSINDALETEIGIEKGMYLFEK